MSVVAGVPKRYRNNHHTRTPGVPSCGYTVDEESGCWVWGLATDKGYGRISIGGLSKGAHRVMYKRLVGPIPEGMQLDHLCRNRACVNPDHLEPVTNLENQRRAPRVKLSIEKARAIRASTEPTGVLARRYGVGISLISSVRAGRAWKDEDEAAEPEVVTVVAWDRAAVGLVSRHHITERFSVQHIAREGGEHAFCGTRIPWMYWSPGDGRRCPRCYGVAARRGYVDEYGEPICAATDPGATD